MPLAKPPKPIFSFNQFAKWTSRIAGRPVSFILAVFVILGWVLTGPIFHYSNTWQLIINTGTTIITFLMVFLIQNTQNRDSQAIHVKLDELIRAMRGARNALLDLDELTDEELEQLRASFAKLGARAGGPHIIAPPSDVRGETEKPETAG